MASPRHRWVVRLALLAEGVLARLGWLPGQRERREGGTAFFLLVPLRLRLLLFLGAAHLTLGHDVPPVLACPRARAVAGLKRRGRTDSSGVSRPRKSVVAGILCCLLPLGGRNRRPQLFDYSLCLTTYRVCASETASLAHRGASPETS